MHLDFHRPFTTLWVAEQKGPCPPPPKFGCGGAKVSFGPPSKILANSIPNFLLSYLKVNTNFLKFYAENLLPSTVSLIVIRQHCKNRHHNQALLHNFLKIFSCSGLITLLLAGASRGKHNFKLAFLGSPEGSRTEDPSSRPNFAKSKNCFHTLPNTNQAHQNQFWGLGDVSIFRAFFLNFWENVPKCFSGIFRPPWSTDLPGRLFLPYEVDTNFPKPQESDQSTVLATIGR